MRFARLLDAAPLAAFVLLLGAGPAFPSTMRELPGTVEAQPGAPVEIATCRATVVPSRNRSYVAELQPYAAYRNVSDKTVDGVAISFTLLDPSGREIEESTFVNSDLKPGAATAATWISYEFTADTAAVRCTLLAVVFTTGASWGTFPAETFAARHRVIRNAPCGDPGPRRQPSLELREPTESALVDPRHARIVIRGSEAPPAVLRELRFVPGAGPVVRFDALAHRDELLDATTGRGPYDTPIAVTGLAGGTTYRVIAEVIDLERSTEKCPVLREQALGKITTAP